MKILLIPILTASAFFFALLPGADAQNLLKNGDFSSGLEGWATNSFGKAMHGAEFKVEVLSDAGQKSGKVLRLTDNDGGAGLIISQQVAAQPAKNYTLTFMSRDESAAGSAASPGYVVLGFYDSHGKLLNDPNAPSPTGTPTLEERKMLKPSSAAYSLPGKGWKPATIESVAPPGTVKVGVNLRTWAAGRTGTVDVSDVSLIQK
jgi:hypothetical protein